MRILIVEDYLPLRSSLQKGLREAGYAVDSAVDGDEGLAFAESNLYDLIILDIMLPRINGLDVLKRLRQRGCPSRILLLTAKDTVDDRVQGLDMGADDYLVKPFALEELMARIRVLQRRQYTQRSPVIAIADLEIDTVGRIVRRNGDVISLTAREYGILEVLAFRRGQIVARDEIWDRIYDFDAERNSNVVDVYVGYLRKKLERDGQARLIHTKRGLGYVLAEDFES